MGNYKIENINCLKDEFSKMMEDFFGKRDDGVIDYDFIPLIDVIDKGEVVVVEAELPGVENSDVEISFDKNILTIKGIKKPRICNDMDLFHRIERNYGKFHRNISIPYYIEESGIVAEFKKGIISITLPKMKNEEEKKIKIVFQD